MSIRDVKGLPYTALPEVLIGDEVRLKQILINLCKNGLKFTRKGAVQILASYDMSRSMLVI